MEIKIDEKQIAEAIINELKKHNLIGEKQNVTVVYNAESKDVLYTVSEVAALLKSNVDYVHKLRKAGLLPFLKIGSYKVRKSSLDAFLERFEGYDISNPYEIKKLDNE